MSTNPDMAPPAAPASAEVARVDTTTQRHALDDLRQRLHEKALESAGRAQGTAALAEQKASQAIERVVVIEDHVRETRADLKEIKATVDGIKSTVGTLATNSPIQQTLYALTALTWFGVGAYMLYDRFMGSGPG